MRRPKAEGQAGSIRNLLNLHVSFCSNLSRSPSLKMKIKMLYLAFFPAVVEGKEAEYLLAFQRGRTCPLNLNVLQYNTTRNNRVDIMALAILFPDSFLVETKSRDCKIILAGVLNFTPVLACNKSSLIKIWCSWPFGMNVVTVHYQYNLTA